ncbi:MAG: AsmA-like C-terminal region-containing protein [Bacteroidota bacterium]|nr:AsmA-like C-terminal region-containing protein [Bacteroidota bacterium]
MKKALKITCISFLVLIALAFIIPVVFKKQIQALVKREINKSIDAKVDFSDVKLSLFRHFPRVGIIIKDLTIIGSNEFAGDTLIATKQLDAAAGLFSVLKGKDIKVSGVTLESPRIHVLITKEGKLNWDIAKASSNTSNNRDTSASAFKMKLKRYSINDGYLLFRDEQAHTFTEIEGLDHNGSGDLTADVFDLSTTTKANSASFTQDGIPYLVNTKTTIETAIKIDNRTNTYTFSTDDIVLNNLKLSASGFIQMVNSTTFNMDVKFKSPTNDFKDILSMIPVIYQNDFAKIKTSGKAVFNGFVKGTYTPQKMPAYEVNLEVKDGSFQYPDLPKPVKNIQLTLQASNVDGQPDNAIINIPKGHLEMDNEPFDFRFVYTKPVTIQLIDAAAKGKIDLGQLSRFIKLPAGTKLSGLVWADAFVKGPMNALQQQTGLFTAGGFFDIRNLYYADNSFPQPIKNGNIKATLENSGGVADKTVINVSSGHIEVGNDPVDFTLQLSNPVSTVDFSGHAKGRFTLDNLKQFAKLPAGSGGEPGTSVSGLLNADMGFSGNKTAIDQKQFDKILLTGTAGVTNLTYKSPAYPTGIVVSNSQLTFNQKTVTLSSLSGQYLTTNFTATGVLNNLVGYVMQGEPLSGNLKVDADKMNLNDWMGTTASTPAATATNNAGSPFLVPADVNFTINASADQVKYDKVDYNNVNGTLVLNDESVNFQNVKTAVLDGNVTINGSYSTKLNKKEPDIGLSYDIKDMDVQKAFLSYNTIQALMPIGKFLAGKLSSQLSLTGNLYGNMMPKLNSLTGSGNLFLLEGVLKKFAPLEKLAALLQIDRLKSISIKDIRNYIEFANGRVLVKPFNIKIDNIEMQIGGFHGFDQSIDYGIQMKLPRSVMGAKGNDLVNGLVTQANSKGIPLKLSETINLNIKMTGSINNPNIGINLKEVAGDAIKQIEEQAKDFVQAKIDSAKQKVKDSLQAVKEKVTEKLKDKLKKQIFGKDTSAVPNNNPLDSTPKKTDPGIKKTIKDIFNRPKKPATDSVIQ